ncbi:hypothetical protein BT69DRAFT_1276799, partial [Atractiella rhizophila]
IGAVNKPDSVELAVRDTAQKQPNSHAESPEALEPRTAHLAIVQAESVGVVVLPVPF